MSLTSQIIVILILYIFCFFDIRFFLYGIKRYQLNNSAYKKRKEGETFKEWFFYTRYKEEIPKILLALYFYVLIIHPLSILACFLVHAIKLPSSIGEGIALCTVLIDCVGGLLLGLLFWSPTRRDYPYERWIAKKRGQKKKQKK